MSNLFIVTPRDRALLERILRLPGAMSPRVATFARNKLETAKIVPADAVPASVALFESRIRYRLGTAAVEMHTLSSDPSAAGLGMFLPVSTNRAIALLGLREGQSFSFEDAQGKEQTVTLEEVVYQRQSANQPLPARLPRAAAAAAGR